jgi:maltose phosphorylase
MKSYYKTQEWSVIEEGFDASRHEASESIFSLGNGHMGQRANFEEKYTGESLPGTYIAGIFYPDKTRVGWWKNGYPEYFAKVCNAPSWIGIHVSADGEELDLNTCEIQDFRRELNMKNGYLERSFIARLKSGRMLGIHAKRFLSMAEDEIGAIRYAVRLLNFSGTIEFRSWLQGDVVNRDSNYDEKFWDILETGADPHKGYLLAKTKKSGFEACFAMKTEVTVNGKAINELPSPEKTTLYSCHTVKVNARENDTLVFHKYVAVLDSLNYEHDRIIRSALKSVENAASKKFDRLFDEHAEVWNEKWSHSDIIIEGDPLAQQGIRFNIFQLNQTYTGRDERLNIGPKGFTGEKYGGSTYWDTEAFLLQFYLSTEPERVARNLLIYRYKHLQKAIENAQKLGFHSGAALYPMVTMNGEECHNEWEITFEEIHRNGAIAYAIYNYIRYTGDHKYLSEYGLEVLIAISRFWRQRANWSEEKQKYVILGVTGPNEYENNVNNNWYTNKMACWTLKYTLEALDEVKKGYPQHFGEIMGKTSFQIDEETHAWKHILDHMYFPEIKESGIFLQQDGYMDKEQRLASDLDPAERPINQNWSWDRILRSVFIKQADVLQGMFCFEEEFSTDSLRRNFNFYEPRTVHESSLSPCIHSILASRIGEHAKAYELYLRTSRLDLDDYNREVSEGLHITSMGGTWMSIVLGFGGFRIENDIPVLNPRLPEKWKSLSFSINFRGRTLKFCIKTGDVSVKLIKGEPIRVKINNKIMECQPEKSLI